VAIELGGELEDEQMRRLEKVATPWTVRRSVEAGIEFFETIERREHPAAHRPTQQPPASTAPSRRAPRAAGSRVRRSRGRITAFLSEALIPFRSSGDA
jgi:hypothetical protein